MNDLIEHIYELHTTELGIMRLKKNLELETEDVVEWCKRRILSKNAKLERTGKNWYVTIDNFRMTVNAHSYTIITAHKLDDKI